MATYKVTGETPDEWKLVDKDEWEHEQQRDQQRQHLRESRAERLEMVKSMQGQAQPITQALSPSDLMMPNNNSFGNESSPSSKHDVKVSATPEGQAKAFLMTFLYGLCPLYAILSAGIIWTATGAFNAPLWLLMVGLLGSITWLGYAFVQERNSPSGVEIHRITNRAKTEQMAIRASADIAQQRMRFEQQMRLQEHQMKMNLLNGEVTV